jgi:hypothetical protein
MVKYLFNYSKNKIIDLCYLNLVLLFAVENQVSEYLHTHILIYFGINVASFSKVGHAPLFQLLHSTIDQRQIQTVRV